MIQKKRKEKEQENSIFPLYKKITLIRLECLISLRREGVRFYFFFFLKMANCGMGSTSEHK